MLPEAEGEMQICPKLESGTTKGNTTSILWNIGKRVISKHLARREGPCYIDCQTHSLRLSCMTLCVSPGDILFNTWRNFRQYPNFVFLLSIFSRPERNDITDFRTPHELVSRGLIPLQPWPTKTRISPEPDFTDYSTQYTVVSPPN